MATEKTATVPAAPGTAPVVPLVTVDPTAEQLAAAEKAAADAAATLKKDEDAAAAAKAEDDRLEAEAKAKAGKKGKGEDKGEDNAPAPAIDTSKPRDVMPRETLTLQFGAHTIVLTKGKVFTQAEPPLLRFLVEHKLPVDFL